MTRSKAIITNLINIRNSGPTKRALQAEATILDIDEFVAQAERHANDTGIQGSQNVKTPYFKVSHECGAESDGNDSQADTIETVSESECRLDISDHSTLDDYEPEDVDAEADTPDDGAWPGVVYDVEVR